MASNLTPEQRARIEDNRKLALAKRAAKLGQNQTAYKENPHNIVKPQCNQSINPCSGPTVLLKTSNFPVKQFLKSDCGSGVNVSSTSSNNTLDYSKNSNTSTLQYQNILKTPLPSSVHPPKAQNLTKTQNKEGNTNFQRKHNTPNSSKHTDPISGVCRLISKDRFTVDIPYHQQTIDLFRTVVGKEYDCKTKQWTFPVKQYFNFKKIVSVLRPHVVIGELPKCVVETFITRAKEFQQDISEIDISIIDEKLRQTIYPFQKEGIQYGISKKGRCLIADDMGLGKSIQALGIADYFRSDWPLLIICPSSMRFQWEEEIRIQLPNSVPTHQVFVMSTGKDDVEGANVLILSYDLLAKKKELVKNMGFGVLILDESHSIKSSKTQRGQAALEIAEHCKRVILLSGTPVLSRPKELYTQIRAVDKSAFPYFTEYGVRYCNGTQTRFGWDFSGSSNMEELKILLETRFMIRRLKSNVLTQLPSKVRQVIVLNNKKVLKNNESMDAFALKLQSSSLKGLQRHGTLLSYFSETAKTKCPAVCEYIVDLLQDNRKFLVFAHHNEILDALSETLEKNKTHYIRIDGSVSAESRKILCDKFQYEEQWRVAVLSIKAANTGLTLTAAQVVVFAELFWNPGDLVQAEDRAHRIGQEDCVVVKYLIAKGTADDYLWPLIQNKLEVLNKAGLSKETNMAAITKCSQTSSDKKETQTKIDDFFNDPFGEEDDEELLKIMDEVDGVVEKKMKLDS